MDNYYYVQGRTLTDAIFVGRYLKSVCSNDKELVDTINMRNLAKPMAIATMRGNNYTKYNKVWLAEQNALVPVTLTFTPTMDMIRASEKILQQNVDKLSTVLAQLGKSESISFKEKSFNGSDVNKFAIGISLLTEMGLSCDREENNNYMNPKTLEARRQSMVLLEMELYSSPIVQHNTQLSRALLNSIKSSTPMKTSEIKRWTSTLKASNNLLKRQINKYNTKKLVDQAEDGVAVGFSVIIDFSPLVGDVKGISEGIQGYDAITGEPLVWWQRALGIACVSEVAGMNKFSKAVEGADNVEDILKEAEKLSGKSIKNRHSNYIISLLEHNRSQLGNFVKVIKENDDTIEFTLKSVSEKPVVVTIAKTKISADALKYCREFKLRQVSYIVNLIEHNRKELGEFVKSIKDNGNNLEFTLKTTAEKPVVVSIPKASISADGLKYCRDFSKGAGKVSIDALKDAKKWLEALTQPELQSLRNYQTGTYKKINQALRDGLPIDGDMLSEIKNIDSAIGKGILTQDEIFYRGFTNKRLIENWESITKGSAFEFVDNGFTSTSKQISVANNFAKDAGKDGIAATIRAKKGTNVANLEALNTPYFDEAEILIERGLNYKVVKAWEENGIKKVILEVE